MNTREKLIELVSNILAKYDRGCLPFVMEEIADLLIANGVTIPVRCKECEYNLHGGCSVEWDIRQDSENWFEQFCSEGKRKE